MLLHLFNSGTEMPLGPRTTFTVAAKAWLDSKIDLEEATRTNYISCIKALTDFFGSKRLERISPDLIRSYQAKRIAAISRGRTNIETCVLRQILKRARLWHKLSYDYKDLKLEGPGPGKAMSDEEEAHLLDTSGSRPEWKYCDLAIRLALATTMAGVEIKGLRDQDIDCNQRLLYIQRGKNKFRKRVIPINVEAFSVLGELANLAGQHGADGGYLFPFRTGETYDHTRPMVTWRHAWKAITKAAELEGLRFHDLRHHAITRLLENPNISQDTVMAITGHNTFTQLRKYTHVRVNRMREAVEKLERKPAAPSSGQVFVQNWTGKLSG